MTPVCTRKILPDLYPDGASGVQKRPDLYPQTTYMVPKNRKNSRKKREKSPENHRIMVHVYRGVIMKYQNLYIRFTITIVVKYILFLT